MLLYYANFLLKSPDSKEGPQTVKKGNTKTHKSIMHSGRDNIT